MPVGLTLRQLSNVGDTTKSAPLTNAEVDQNLINLRNSSTITVLDDLTDSFDGVTKTFSLYSNAVAVDIGNPHALLITLGNMMLQPYFMNSINSYEAYVFQQEVAAVLIGNYTTSGNTITFVDAPNNSQKFYGRVLGSYVNNSDTSTRNVFKAVPIVLS